MGLFKHKKKIVDKNRITLDSILNDVIKLLNADKYISKKEYKDLLENYHRIFNEIDKSKLKKYCKDNNLNYKELKIKIDNYGDIENKINNHNTEFIKNHRKSENDYLRNILKDIDQNIVLDDEQIEVVLSDEDYTLVIAGAGAGKTTTIAGKVKYLVEKQGIDPKEILIISFTNKAVDELKERINKRLNIECPITTFHKAGYTIIKKDDSERYKIVTDYLLYVSINEFLNNMVMNDKELLIKTVLFFSYYINFDDASNIDELKYQKEFRRIETLRSQLDEVISVKEQQKITIRTEFVRSVEEAKIANFLYINGINYEYERPYPKLIPGMKRPYLPDFTIFNGDEVIYLEHFGVSEDHKSSMYSEEKLKKYCDVIDKKIKLHNENHTKLIYTYSKYNDGEDIIKHLEEILRDNNINFNPVNENELFNKIVLQKDNTSMMKLNKLLNIFINNYKANGYDEEYFEILTKESKSERNKVFLEIAHKAYTYYQSKLKETKSKDFQDLINDSKKILDEVEEMKDILSFKYIIVDEYQDISLQRFNLTKRLSEVTNAKIMAVGDDWQSIYAFAGSKIKLFTDFEKMMGYAKQIRINNTYRNSQELIDIAGYFIQKNDFQTKRKLISTKHLDYPVAIFSYSDDTQKNEQKGLKGIIYEKAKAVQKALDTIVKRNKKENSKVLLIGRYGFDGQKLGETEFFNYTEEPNGKAKFTSVKYPNLKIEFLTAHSSKGLGSDEVIIINGGSGVYGFPSEKTSDPVLNMVVYNDRSYEDAEERRLFYVALTRTKNRVYIIVPKHTPSKFVLEIKDNKNVYKDYDFTEIVKKKKLGNYCPHCGFPIYYKASKAFGEKMYVCSNDPEICGFVTNNMKGGKTSVRKCPICKDGYLFIRKVKDEETYFLGCSNYKKNGKGCNYSQNLDNEN